MALLTGLNKFLFQYSGATAQAIDKLFDNKLLGDGPQRDSVFFRPYTSAGNFFKRTAEVATAPILFSIITLEFSALTLSSGLKTAYHLATLDTTKAKQSAEALLTGVLLTVSGMIAALASPFINLVDLVGSLFVNNATAKDQPALQPR